MDPMEFVNKLPGAFNPEAADGTNCVIQFNTSKPAYATIKDSTCTVAEGTATGADVTLTIGDEDLVALMTGELNGMTAFMTGKLQIDGDLMLAQRLSGLFDPSRLG
jgi:putative sterol carrier protein